MKANSFFKKLFICLTLLLILPVIIINTISNYEVLKNSEMEISNNSIGKLKVAENTLVQLEDSVFKEAVRLSVDTTINELNNFHGEIDITNGNNIVRVLHVLDILSELVRVNDKYDSVYLYLDDFDYTFTSNNDLVKKDLLGDTGWIKYYDDYKNKKVPLSMLTTRIPSNDSKNDKTNSSMNYVMTYIYPLTPYTTNLNGALVVNIKEDAVNNIINGSNANTEGYIFITNNNGDIITNSNTKLLAKNLSKDDYMSKILNNKSSQGYLTTTIDGNKSIVSFLKSNFNNWIFIGVFPITSLSNKVSSIRITTVYMSLFIMVIGILISFFISKRISSPLEKLINDIKTTKGIDIIGDGDEMSILHRAFNTLIKKDKALFDILEKNKIDIKDNCLKNLLNGDISGEMDISIANERFIYNYYICAVISIDKYNEFTKLYREEKYYMKNLISQVSSEVIEVNFLCESLNLSKGETVLIVNTDKCDNVQQILEQSFIKVKEEIAKVLENSITIGIGMCHCGVAEIQDSYFEAQTALKQKLKLGSNNVILWNEFFTSFNYYYPFKIEEYLLNSLQSQSKECLELTLDELVDDLVHKCSLSSENIIQIFTQLVGNTIVKYLLEQHLNIYDIFGAKFNIYYELSAKETIQEIRCWLSDIYSQIIEFHNNTIYSNREKLDSIIEYITNNYQKDIGIKDISESIGLSYSHVRKIFMDEVGESIIDYINNIRVKEAKELLIKTKLSIKNIATNLGYNNDQSFTRFFKKYEGITPGEYRNKKML